MTEATKALVVCTTSYDRRKGGSTTHACPEDSMVALCGTHTRECTWQTLAEKGQVSCKRCTAIIARRDAETKPHSQ